MAYRVSLRVRKKGPQFKIRFEQYVDGVRKSRDIPKDEWAQHGFHVGMFVEEAQAQRDSLNASEHLKRHQERRQRIAARMDQDALAELAFLPAPMLKEFEERLFGRKKVTPKLQSY